MILLALHPKSHKGSSKKYHWNEARLSKACALLLESTKLASWERLQ